MTATDLEALARRVEIEPASDELRDAIARAFGYTKGRLVPDFPYSIDAAASLLPSDWRLDIGILFERTWVVAARLSAPGLSELCVPGTTVRGTASGDHAEARARCAAAIRVLAMEKKPLRRWRRS